MPAREFACAAPLVADHVEATPHVELRALPSAARPLGTRESGGRGESGVARSPVRQFKVCVRTRKRQRWQGEWGDAPSLRGDESPLLSSF